MIQLNAEEKKQLRANFLDLVENRLPPLMETPVPESIRSQSWFKESKIEKILRVYNLHCGKMDVGNGKTPPALKAWLMDEAAGKFENKPRVIGATSANWGMASGLIAPIFNVRDFTAVIENSVPEGKRAQLIASGADILVVPDGVVATDYVYDLAEKDSDYHLIDQYVHEGSISGHEWTMNHINRELARLGLNASLFGAVTGTCSTLMAARRYLPSDVKLFGVASMSKEEKIPGSRAPENLKALKRIGGFPYETAIDFPLMTSVTKREAYALNADFVQRYLIPMGPTGALLQAGFYHLLRKYHENGTLDQLKNKAGLIVLVGFIMDMHLPYLSDPEYLEFFKSR